MLCNGSLRKLLSFFIPTVAPEDPSRKVDGDTIIFSAVQERSSAVYQCNASNEYGYLLANAFVNVLGKKHVFIFFSLRGYLVVSCYYTNCMPKPWLRSLICGNIRIS